MYTLYKFINAMLQFGQVGYTFIIYKMKACFQVYIINVYLSGCCLIFIFVWLQIRITSFINL